MTEGNPVAGPEGGTEEPEEAGPAEITASGGAVLGGPEARVGD